MQSLNKLVWITKAAQHNAELSRGWFTVTSCRLQHRHTHGKSCQQHQLWFPYGVSASVWVTGCSPVLLFPCFSQKAHSIYVLHMIIELQLWISSDCTLVCLNYQIWSKQMFFIDFFYNSIPACSPPPRYVLHLNWKFSRVVSLCRYISLPNKVNYLSVVNGFKHHHSTHK